MLLVFVAAAAAAAAEPLRLHNGSEIDIGDGAQCGAYSRVATAQAVLDTIDVDGDDCVTLDELAHAYGATLTWYERAALWAGAAQTPGDVVRACAADGRQICIDDLLRTGDECAHGHSECMCACKHLEQLHHYVLARL